MSIPQYYGATGYLMVKHSDHLKVVDRLKAENEALRKALESCSEELAAEVICKHGGQKPEDMHPVTLRLFERDMAPVVEARAALGSGEKP